MPLDDKLSRLRHLAKTDKFFLANEVLGYEFQPEPHAELFKAYLQKNPDVPLQQLDEVKNRLILWSRGHYKTTASAVEMVQLILNYPDIRILIVSANVPEAKKRLKEVKDHFESNPKLQKLFPEFCAPRLGNSMHFTVKARKRNFLREATVSVSSARTAKAGPHFDVIFIDDLVTDQNSRTKEQLERAIDDYRAAVPLLDPGGYIFVTGTRYSFDDAYGWIQEQIEREGLKHWLVSIKTCWADAEAKIPLFPETTVNGKTIGFTAEKLENIRKEEGDGFFACQYLNDPLGSGQQIFTRELIYTHVLPEETIPQRGGGVIFAIDLAFSDSERADETAIIVARVKDGKNYIIDIAGGKLNPTQQCEEVCRLTYKYRPHAIFIEKARSTEHFDALVRMYAMNRGFQQLPIVLVPKGNTKDAKITRIANVQTVLNEGRLWFKLGLPMWDKVESQLLLFPKSQRHDDFADAIGMVCQAPTGYDLVAISSDSLPWFLREQAQPEKYPDNNGLPHGLVG